MTTILALFLTALLSASPAGIVERVPVAPIADAEQMTIARLQYDGGGDWYVGPSSLPNLLKEIRARTGLPVAEQPVTVRLTDPRLWRHPFLFLTGHGNVRFSEEEVTILRRYLLTGGFLLADDCYGMDVFFRREIARVFPDKQMVPLPHDHPVFHLEYKFPNGPPKVHEHDGNPPQAFGIFHDGRLVMLYLYESDIHDGWEDAEVHDTAADLREASFRLGINIFLYALAQVAP